MASQREADAPLIVIVGPTASGKTGLAIDLAKKHNGEIICADSRTIFRGMNIGTAKPTLEEQAAVPHWGIDLVSPGERFTAADFKEYAERKVKEIRKRGRVPFLVGGTGLYIDAIVFDFKFQGGTDLKKRAELERMTLEELHEYCHNNNITLPENKFNKRYVVRMIERRGQSPRRSLYPINNLIVVGIATSRETLRQRIADRAEQIFTNSVVEEAILLGKKYGWNSEAMTGNIYPLIRRYVQGEFNIDEVKKRFIIADWQLAKRQLTWFRRNPFIQWLELQEAEQYIDSFLAKR